MTASLQVLLAVALGVSTGAAIMAGVAPPPQAAKETMAAPEATDADGAPSGARSPSEEYENIARALMALEERFDAMEERDSATREQVDTLLDDVRELALQLEIRSGQLKPLRPENAGKVESLRKSLPKGIHPVPALPRPAAGSTIPGVTEDGLPEW